MTSQCPDHKRIKDENITLFYTEEVQYSVIKVCLEEAQGRWLLNNTEFKWLLPGQHFPEGGLKYIPERMEDCKPDTVSQISKLSNSLSLYYIYSSRLIVKYIRKKKT